MSTVAVVGVFYRRPEFVPRIAAALRAQTRPPDQVWLMCEEDADRDALAAEKWPGLRWISLVTFPRDENGRPLLVPPSVLINAALDDPEFDADYVTYLADDSLPGERKLELMAKRLDEGADVVYCSQDRGSVPDNEAWLAAGPGGGYIHRADHPEDAPWCKVDMTQVMHRTNDLRWPTDMRHIKIGDAEFWNLLRDRYGAFQPVDEVLDWHRQLPSGITATWPA